MCELPAPDPVNGVVNSPDGQAAFDAYLATLPSYQEQKKIDVDRWNKLFEGE